MFTFGTVTMPAAALLVDAPAALPLLPAPVGAAVTVPVPAVPAAERSAEQLLAALDALLTAALPPNEHAVLALF